ncbi:MAG: TlpA family protein disulfide reductase, partial [Pirellulaceae bacterium]|nr:TlpA family protein disulfide reductase [Pirellulaceae bacterium]
FVLTEQRGRVVVLDFWASWCGPCIATMPKVDAIVEQFDPNDVELVAVNLQDSVARANLAIDRMNLNATVIMDVDGEAGRFYDARAIPQTVIVNRDGDVTHLFVGGGTKFLDEFATALKTVVAAESRTPRRTDAPPRGNSGSDSAPDAMQGSGDKTSKTKINRTYHLRDDQVLKWVPSSSTTRRPDDPERDGSGHVYIQDGTELKLKIRSGSGEPEPLHMIVFKLLRVFPCDVTGDAKLWMTNIGGDFVLRKGADKGQVTEALQAILREQMELAVSLKWVQRRAEVWVVDGEFHPDPIGEPWRRPEDKAYVFYGVNGPVNGRHQESNAGTFDDLLKAFGARTGLPVVSELTKSPDGHFGWQTWYDDMNSVDWDDFPRQYATHVDLVAKHFAQQTGLDFHREDRSIQLLKLSSKSLD